jgi:hypothetical protein
MKPIIFSVLAVVGVFFFISCERHTWEDSSEGAKDGTKRLFPKSGGHSGESSGTQSDPEHVNSNSNHE